MMDMQVFKEQLLDLVNSREKPFDEDFVMKYCNQPISYIWVHDVLCQLEEEGKLIRLDRRYFPTQVLVRRWIMPIRLDKNSDGGVLPNSMIREIKYLLQSRPELGYTDVNEFVRDAVRRFLSQT